MARSKSQPRSVHPDAIPITKIETVRRELETAIKLYFYQGDEVSVHVLTCAAHEILRQIGKASGTSSIIFDARTAPVAENLRAEVHAVLTDDYHFFKHAGSDPNETLHFNPAVTLYFLFDAVNAYCLLTKSMPDNFSILKSWVMIRRPDWFKGMDRSKLDPIAREYGENRRTDYYEFALQQVAAVHSKMARQ
jgi:hypothetical protein